MSAGHGHRRPNYTHAQEVEALMARGGAPELMERFQELNVDCDVADLCGYNVAGTVRYMDKDIFRALVEPEYAKQLGLKPIDTGMSPEDTVECLMVHEATEKVLLDADNDIDSYQSAHEYATSAEHEMVRKKGGKPFQYERGLAQAIAWCERKKLQTVDPDFACAPLLDDPDAADKRALKELRARGADDAFKKPRAAVDYSRSSGEDRCAGCAHWQASDDTGPDLSRCSEVDGLVRAGWWCRLFEAATQEERPDGQELDQGSNQEQGRIAPVPRTAGGREDTSSEGGGGNPLQEPAGPQAGEPRQDA